MTQFRVWSHMALAPEALALLEPVATVVARPVRAADPWQAEAATFDALLVGGNTLMNGPVMDLIGDRLRVIARAGIGVDLIDLAAATERGIMVVNTPDGPTESTAEHAIALIFALAKLVSTTDRRLRAGQGFPSYGAVKPGLELRGATLGLVGLGRIGGRVAEIAGAVGMRVRAFDPFAAPARAAALGVELALSLSDLLGSAEIVSIHCPSLPETYRLINAATLGQMRPGSYLVNVSRGALVDEAALGAALESGHLAGAGLDVFDPEPPAPDNPLFALPNTICTTHVGSYTEAGVLRMQTMVAEEIVYALRGKRPPNLVNPAVWGTQRRPAG